MNGRTNSSPLEIESLEVPLDTPTNLVANPGNAQITLTWTDPENKHAVIVGDTAEESDQLVSEFDHSVIVRKNNSDPTGPSDGTVVTTGTKNQYQSTGYIDTSLPNGIEYHYGVYAVNKAGVFSNGIYAHATPMAYRAASTFAVGSTLKMNISGTPWDFIVVQQGLPTTAQYDSNCNGTWLFMKNTYIEKEMDSNEYQNTFDDSELQYYLNNEFYNMFDSPHRSIIKSVNVPSMGLDFHHTNYTAGVANGHIFLPSMAELGFSYYFITGSSYSDGGVLEYFANTNPNSADSKRVSGDRKRYWVRTPSTGRSPTYMCGITANGAEDMSVSFAIDNANPVRPMMIIDPNALFNDDGELLIS